MENKRRDKITPEKLKKKILINIIGVNYFLTSIFW
jgi:hypothetical protein